MIIKTAAQMREMDQIAIEEYGIPSLELMENAATTVLHVILENYPSAKRIVILCGYGNNGGDGIALARLLHEKSVTVFPYLFGEKDNLSKDASAMYMKMQACGLDFLSFDGTFPECDLIVDAIFGVGLARPIEGIFKAVITHANQANVPVVACDIPSGISADTGEILGCAIKAAKTVTFSCLKPGLLKNSGKTYSGEITVTDIGIPEELKTAEV